MGMLQLPETFLFTQDKQLHCLEKRY